MATPPCSSCNQPSVYACSCRIPALPFCKPCSYQHQADPPSSGQHAWTEFRLIETENRACKLCSEFFAEKICCCEFPVVVMCAGCQSDHMVKNSAALHLIQPIDKEVLIESQRDIDNARKVIEKKNQIETYLRLNKEAAEKLRIELIAYFDEMVAHFTKEKDSILKQIRDIEETIERKKAKLRSEVGENLFCKQPLCSELLSQVAFNSSVPFTDATVLSAVFNKKLTSEMLLQEVCIPEMLRLRPSFECSLPNARLSALSLPAQDSRSKADMLMNPAFHDARPSRQLLQVSADPNSFQGQSNPVPPQNVHLSIPLALARAQKQQEHSASRPVVGVQAPPQSSRLLEITQEMIAEFHSPCKEDFNSRTPETPKTIGRHRLSIHSLQCELNLNQHMEKKFREISSRYLAWRRCLYDEHSFYRCVGVLFCEHYCRPDTPLDEFHLILNKIIGQNDHFQLFSDSLEVLSSLKYWIALLKNLFNSRVSRENSLQKLQYFLQKKTANQAIIIAMRYYVATYLRLHSSESVISEAVKDIPVLIREIQEERKAANDAVLLITARTLNVILHIVTVDKKSGSISEAMFGPEAQGWYPAFNMLRLSSHYDILISKECSVVDRYDFASNSYAIGEKVGRAVDYEEFRI